MMPPADDASGPLPCADMIEVPDLVAMRRVLHELFQASPMSAATIERIAGLPADYVSKTLAERPLRGLSGNTIFLLTAVLGRKIVLHRDPAAEARVKAHHDYVVSTVNQKRFGVRRASALALVSRWAQEAARKRIASMSPEEFRAHQSRAAKARWRAFRRARRSRGVMVEPPAAP
jgi:hypothetical protein